LREQIKSLSSEKEAFVEELQKAREGKQDREELSSLCAGLKSFIAQSHEKTLAEVTNTMRGELNAFTERAEKNASELVAELRKQVDEMSKQLKEQEEEKAAMAQKMKDARREMLSDKCRYGLLTKRSAIKEFGDSSFKPPNCLFSDSQIKEIKKWLKEGAREEAATTSHPTPSVGSSGGEVSTDSVTTASAADIPSANTRKRSAQKKTRSAS
uniref:BDP1 factor n=1 Tax=Steinernema glaseri TaxID=37863 RepID=A0A1I7ZP09_9BILA